MVHTPTATKRDSSPSSIFRGNGEGQWPVRLHRWQAGVSSFHRRFDPVTFGFRLGAVVLGAGGCLLGACMPYCHPVAVVISVLWWGTFCGCFGGSIGALVGLFTESASISPYPGSVDARKSPGKADSPVLPAGRRKPAANENLAGSYASERTTLPLRGEPRR
jgi:hypothetical protein